MAQRIQFAIQNARSFRNTGLIPLSPLTLLVGENSSGKTSFSALLCEAMDFFAPGSIQDGTFFDLGSFDDIVHYSRSKKRRADHYTTSFEMPGKFPRLEAATNRNIDQLGISITYGERKGSRFVKQVHLGFNDNGLLFDLKEDRIDLNCKVGNIQANYVVKMAAGAPDISYFLTAYWGVSDLLGRLKIYKAGSKQGIIEIQSKGLSQDIQKKMASIFAAMEESFDSIIQDVRWMITPTSAMRSAPQRVYTPIASQAGEQNNTPYQLYRLYQYEPAIWAKVHRGLVEFGINSGLFDDIEVRPLRGRRKSGPFEIIIHRGRISSNIMDVGYGVGQAIPFVFDVLLSDAYFNDEQRYKLTRAFYVQQPETHLHPSAQAALGSFFYSLSKNSGRYILIETHSDYIINRIRQHIRSDNKGNSENCSLLFFDHMDGVSTIYPMEFDNMGNLLDPPDDYRTFFINEELKTLGVL